MFTVSDQLVLLFLFM